jgi:hypothetical protein
MEAEYMKRLNEFLANIQCLKEDIKYIEIVRKIRNVHITDQKEGPVQRSYQHPVHNPLGLRPQDS